MNSAKPTDELKFSCPRCGQHLACEASCAGTVIRCPACALDFAAPSLAPTAQPPAQPYQTPTLPGACACPNCGSALPADAVLCVQCGYKFARGKGISTYVSARPGAFAPLLRRLLWVTAAAIVLIGAFVLWSSSKLPAPPPPSPSVLRAGGPGTVKEWVDGEGKTHQYVLKAGDKEDPYEPFYDFVVGNPELTSPALFNFRYLRAIRTSQRIAFFEYSPSGELTDELGRHVAGRTRTSTRNRSVRSRIGWSCTSQKCSDATIISPRASGLTCVSHSMKPSPSRAAKAWALPCRKRPAGARWWLGWSRNRSG